MNYKELFSVIRCERLVIFEDDFVQSKYEKNRFFYDLARMAIEDRVLYLEEIKEISAELETILQSFFSAIDQCFDKIGDWNDCVVQGDIQSALEQIAILDASLAGKLTQEIECFDGEKIQSVYECGEKYGLGIDYTGAFATLGDDYIFSENRACSVRIYSDFSAATKDLLIKDVKQAKEESSIVCIIDNCIKGNDRAAEILQAISESFGDERKYVIGSIFSSREKYEQINDKLYFEYTPKEQPELLKASIAKSAYNFFISELKTETVAELKNAFDKALKNKGIAFFLAKKAQREGASEYEIIKEWVKLLTMQGQRNSNAIKRMICLSKVINSLEDDDGDLPDSDLQKLNTIEAFDYTVNDYYLPVAAGDVFTNRKGEWFVLIGQDCDMARSVSRTPNNAVAELLPANLQKQTEFAKWTNNLSSASIYSFRENLEGDSKILQVEYQKRKYIENEIINLCSFNQNGECKLVLDQPLSGDIESLVPIYMVNYHKELQNFFGAVETLRTAANSEFDLIIKRAFSPRLLSMTQYEYDGSSKSITFDLKRVCRLTQEYVYYLYKLYLEYRGRKPFQTINLIRQEEITLPVMYDGKDTDLYLSFRGVTVPDKSNHRDWIWIVNLEELNRVIERLTGCKLLSCEDEIFLKDVTTLLDLQGDKKVSLTKTKKKVRLSK